MKRDPRPSHLFLGLVVLLGGSACRSGGANLSGDPLPFHLAVMPVEIQDTSVLIDDPSLPVYPEPDVRDPDDMRLELGSRAVTEALSQELGHAFVRTTRLELPADRDELAALDAEGREAYWQERAREVGADLLVRTRLSLDPKIDGDRNEKFWLNLPVFLLAGPLCYFVGDRTYGVSARLQAEVFDVSEGHSELADFALLSIPLFAEAEGVDLAFIERATDAGDYALSILLPAGLLARETDEIEEAMQEELPRQLGRTLASKVFEQRQQFEQNLALGAFQLEAATASLRGDGAGRLHVRVPVRELAANRSLHGYELWADGRMLREGQFPAQAQGVVTRLIEETFEAPDDVDFLTVRLMDAATNVRSYTLAVDRGVR